MRMASAAYRYNADKSSPDFLVGEWATAMPNNDAGAENCVEVAPNTRPPAEAALYCTHNCSAPKYLFQQQENFLSLRKSALF